MKKDPLLLILGPCVVESETLCFTVAEQLVALQNQHKEKIKVIFKSSYKKANRTSVDSFATIGVEKAISILEKVKSTFGLPVLTDVHETTEVDLLTNIDYLQIPAFLCRQTDLILKAAQTGKPVNIKKGQFLSPESMAYAVEKAKSTGNPNIFITERGNSFGYGHLVVDFTGIPIMKKFAPVIMDCTHSTQRPNSSSGITGGNPQFIANMAFSAIVNDADGLFIETHPDPRSAKSDGSNMLHLNKLEELVKKVIDLKEAYEEIKYH